MGLLEQPLLTLELHLLRDSDGLGSLCGRRLRQPLEEAIRVLDLEDRRLFSSLDAGPDVVLGEDKVVRLHLLEDRELEVGVRGVFEDASGQKEHCVAFFPRGLLWVCVLGLPAQGVGGVPGQDELGGLLDAGVAPAFVGFREPHLLCADLVEEVPGDHGVVERGQREAVPHSGVVVGLLVVDDVLDSVRVDEPDVVGLELHVSFWDLV